VAITSDAAAGTTFLGFASGPARDFYLALSAGFEVATTETGSAADVVTINSLAQQGQEEAAEVALRAAEEAVRIFGERFGPYPYAELDVVATPMLALGIEYPGITGIASSLYEPGAQAGGRDALDVIRTTVAHEVAHQWFYNVVGSDQIDEPWLDEAFAQYATGLFLRDAYGDEAEQAYRESWLGRWDRVDRAEKPVGLPAGEYQGREYSAIVYGRGPLFLAALEEQLGRERMEEMLAEYTREFRWDITTTKDFRRVAETACGCDLSEQFAKWVYP
jgi:aminopeptidase N